MLDSYKKTYKSYLLLCVVLLLAGCHCRLRPMKEEAPMPAELFPIWIEAKRTNDYFWVALERSLRLAGVTVLGFSEGIEAPIQGLQVRAAHLLIERPVYHMQIPMALSESGSDQVVASALEIRMHLRLPACYSKRESARTLRWLVEHMTDARQTPNLVLRYCMESMEYERLVDKALVQILPEVLDCLRKSAA